MSDVYNPEPLTLDIQGKTYTIPVPVRRQARRMLSAAMPIATSAQNAGEDMQAGLDLFELMIEYLYEYVPSMKANQVLHDNATEIEIAEAFNALMVFVKAPFVEAQESLPEK